MALSSPRFLSPVTYPARSPMAGRERFLGDVEGPQVPPVRKVTPIQWALLMISVAFAGAGVFLPEVLDIVVLTLVLTSLGLLLLINTALESLTSRLCGKFLLCAATFLSYWLEAAGLALLDPPFPAGDPVPWSQWPESLLRTGLLYVTLFQLCLFIGYSIQPRLRRFADYVVSRVDAPGAGRHMAVFALAACGLVALMAAYGGDPQRTWQGLLAARSGEGPTGDATIFGYLSMVGMYATSLLMVRAFLFPRPGRFLGTTASRVVALAFSLPFVLSGTRHVLLYIALPLVVVYCGRTLRIITTARITRWMLLILLLLSLSQLQAALRGSGWLNFDYQAQSEIRRTDIYGNFTPQLFAQYLVPGVHGYFMEPTTPFFFTHFILRRWWPDKPTMHSWEYYNYMWLRQNVQYGNVTPSVTGQYYINWGVAGILFIGAWLGFLAYLGDHLIRNAITEEHTGLLVSIGMFYAFIIASFRFYAPFYFAYFAFSVPCLFLVTRRRKLTAAVAEGFDAIRARAFRVTR